MKPYTRGLAVALLHCLIALSVFGKYELDRQRLPRAWAKTAPVDPNLPIRGRYVMLRLEVEAGPASSQLFGSGRLLARDGRLLVERDDAGFGASGHVGINLVGGRWVLLEPVAFFLPEHAADPSRVAPGKDLWVEVSVPRKGPPRPIRLEAR